jgi:hypothetical protein
MKLSPKLLIDRGFANTPAVGAAGLENGSAGCRFDEPGPAVLALTVCEC